MTHIMIFTYVAAIAIALVAITVQWLAAKGNQNQMYQSGKPFVIILFTLNVYDFGLFYYTHVMAGGSVNTLASIGDCIIALLVVFWINTADAETEDDTYKKVNIVSKKYFFAYVIIWLISKLFFAEFYLLSAAIDVPYLVLLVALVIREGIFCRQGKETKGYLAYRCTVSAGLFINYLIYLESEIGESFDSYKVLDYTIFVWILISCANIIYLYQRNFAQFSLQKKQEPLSAEDAIRNTALNHSLTARESEILKEIYDGKTNTEIAEKLFISESTVKAHVYNLFRKLGTKSRLDAVRIVREEQKNREE